MRVCNQGRPALMASNSTSIYFIKDAIQYYDIIIIDDLVCSYTPFRRIPPKLDGKEDNNFEYLTTIYFFPYSDHVVVEDEFIMVECFYKQKLIYTDFFAFVPLKSSYAVRNDEDFNVLLMGFDGTSRLNFYRHWPHTRDVLQQFGAEELFGYNKVGGNSFANLMPLLAGVSFSELRELCWPENTTYFDDCSFIWDVYKRNGYVTAYADDTFEHGLFRDSGCMGFKREQHTDYLFDYFIALAELKIGNNKEGYFYNCIGSRETYKVFLNYIEQFLDRMSRHRLKFFGSFFETVMSHDSIFKPKISDTTISLFFNSTLMEKILENTILVVYSDHGARFGKFRYGSFQGFIEDLLPYIAFYFPDSFKNRYKSLYDNFKINRYRLTTPYDIHKTLLDLFQLSDTTQTQTTNIRYSKYYSLFEKIPENRNCDDANIPLEYCACGYSTQVETISETFDCYKSALLIVDTINKMIPQNKCLKLRLHKLLSSRVEIVNATTAYYTVAVETLPSKAIFESKDYYRRINLSIKKTTIKIECAVREKASFEVLANL
nr:uncharacterized protein LOC111420352 [Onthophagus taurus]